jgi:hemerythrin
MMLFKWSTEFAIGVETIDDDHRHLIEIVSQFHDAADSGRIGVMRDTLARLRQHALDHFGREEELQRKVGYPLADAHAGHHRDMLVALDALARRLAVPEAADTATPLREETSSFLIQWFAGHVLAADLKMVPFACRMRDAQPAPLATLSNDG